MDDNETDILSLTVNILSLSHGCALSWTSPSIPYLKSPETHLATGPLTSEDVSWIGSLICFGGVFGTIAFGAINEKIGKRNSMILLVIPHLSFWALVYFSTHAYHLYLARILAGITGGGLLRTVSLYITEISENEIRGVLGTFFNFSMSGGILLIFIAGAYLNYFLIPIVMLALPATYLLFVIFFIRDTPVSLISRNKVDEAFESLKFYRTCSNEKSEINRISAEFELMKAAVENKNEEKLELSDFRELSIERVI